MKKQILYILISLLMITGLSSCLDDFANFLEQPPGVDITEDTIFSSREQMETYLWNVYAQGLHNGLPLWRNYDGWGNQWNHILQAGKTDEGEGHQAWYYSQLWNDGNLNPETSFVGNFMDGRVNERWRAIRGVNIILERIDGVPGLTDEYRNSVRGEVRFIRALNYFEMFKRYGGVPIVKERLTLVESVDELKIPRASLEEVIDFIIEDCDFAIQHLPAVQTQRGRITSVAAHALKSKTLLHAASPLYNASEPYVPFSNPELLCYTNEDPARWNLAAQASLEAINAAEAAGVALYNTGNPEDDYYQMWARNDNMEIILAEKSMRSADSWGGNSPYVGLAPPFARGWGSIMVTFNWIQKYERNDGTPQTWDMDGGDDLIEKYAELDPRFHQSVAYHRSDWNSEFQNLNFDPNSSGGTNATPDEKTGHFIRKHVPREWSGNIETNAVRDWTLFRMAELYLNYAEAENEANGPSPLAYEYVNRVRQRAGMPNLPAGLSQAEFRQRVRNERNIEFAFEDFRYWDMIRWKIHMEEGRMVGNMWGLRVTDLPDGNVNYTPYVFETRSFQDHFTYFPFPQSEIFKDYLIQNPGW